MFWFFRILINLLNADRNHMYGNDILVRVRIIYNIIFRSINKYKYTYYNQENNKDRLLFFHLTLLFFETIGGLFNVLQKECKRQHECKKVIFARRVTNGATVDRRGRNQWLFTLKSCAYHIFQIAFFNH